MAIQRFLGSELVLRPAKECRFQVIPVPYEASVSYGAGTADGPASILHASQQLEVWTGKNIPSTQGIFTWPEVDCEGGAEEVLSRIEASTEHALAHGSHNAIPVLLGGEHTITLGALRALQKKYGHFGIVQFDAHGDLRHSYEGTMYSHACVMRRAVEDLGLSLFQVGVRSLCMEEVEFRASAGIHFLDARDLCQSKILSSSAISSLLPADFPQQIFLTFDVDALDASLMPATGTPEPGGLFFWDAVTLVERCLTGRTVLGLDVVELSPISGMHAPTYTATRLVHEIMGCIK